jgi:hypothetical protein
MNRLLKKIFFFRKIEPIPMAQQQKTRKQQQKQQQQQRRRKTHRKGRRSRKH